MKKKNKLTQFFLLSIRFYQRYFSFDHGFFRLLFLTDKACRFKPSCSEYTYQAIDKYGILWGAWKGLGRILRCHPLNKGGFDPLR